MKQQRHWMEILTDQMDLTGAVEAEPLVEVVGCRRVLVEHHKGIRQYQQDRIGVNVKYGVIVICGSGMEIVRMTGDQLVICGRIDSVIFERRDDR